METPVDAAPDEGATPRWSPWADAEPAESDEALVIAVRRVPGDLDPFGDPDPWARRVLDDLLFEGLVRPGSERFPFVEPALADSCVLTPADAPRHVHCHLAAGHRFHDGEEVTAADVVYSLEHWVDTRRSGLRLRHGLGELDRVELASHSPDAQRDVWGRALPEGGAWIHLAFEGPEPLALERIAAMKVVPEAKHRGHASSFSHAPVGSGPMALGVLEPERLVLERPEGRDQVGPDRIVLRAVPDRAEGLTLLRRGEVHVLAEMAPAHVPEELTRAGTAARFTAWLLTPPRYDLILYDLRHGSPSELPMREALDLALPRAALAAMDGMPPWPTDAPVDRHDPSPVDLALLEQAGVAADWGMAGLPELDGHDDDAGARLAGERLDALGWPLQRGVRRRATGALRLTLMWDGAHGHEARVATAIRDAWRAVGIQVPYATAGWAYIFGLMRKGEFDLALAQLAGTDDLYPYFHRRGVLNLTGVADDELDAALEAYRAAGDLEARREARTRVAARLAAIRPVSVLHAPTRIMLVSRRVVGLEFVDDLPRLDTLALVAEPPHR